jgi:hypothetical protein
LGVIRGGVRPYQLKSWVTTSKGWGDKEGEIPPYPLNTTSVLFLVQAHISVWRSFGGGGEALPVEILVYNLKGVREGENTLFSY